MSDRERDHGEFRFECGYCNQRLFAEQLHVCSDEQKECLRCQARFPVTARHRCTAISKIIVMKKGQCPVAEDYRYMDEDPDMKVIDADIEKSCSVFIPECPPGRR